MATTKSTSRGTLYSDDDVTAGLNLRLDKSEAGKTILDQLSSPPKGRFWLPKLMHCADNHLYCQSNGVYVKLPDGQQKYRHHGYLRFYNDTKQVISVSSTGKPERIWRWFKRENEKYTAGDVTYEWKPTGYNLMRVTFTIVRRHTGESVREIGGIQSIMMESYWGMDLLL